MSEHLLRQLRPSAVTGSFWDRLAEDGRRVLTAAGPARAFGAGATLCRQGRPPADVFVIRSGQVEVWQDDGVGNRTVLARRGPGDLVGEMSALDGSPMSASITALTAGTALIVPATRFAALCSTHPGLGLTVLGNVAARLRDSDAHRVESRGDVLERTVHVLLRLAEGSPADRGTVVVRVTQRDLADMVAAAPVSVGRALEDLRRSGLVRTGRGQIRIDDVRGLADLVSLGP